MQLENELQFLSLFHFLRKDQIISERKKTMAVSQTTLPESFVPELVVYPESATDVEQIIKAAKKIRLPVWYVSTGKNWGYGCKSASYTGGITMVLERMKKIVEVNTTLGYAVIEPGVTYDDLNTYLKKNKIPLWTDSAGTTKAASIIGNALDKGRGLTPYADHFGALCGMDVVLSDGTTMSTSPQEKYHCRHTYKWSIGPWVDGLFAQSNLGVVVRAAVWLMPVPEKFDFFSFEYTSSVSRFPEMIDSFRNLIFSQGLRSFPHLANNFAMLCIVDQYPKHLLQPGEKKLSREAIKKWGDSHGIPEWTFGAGLYGSSLQIAAQKSLIKKYLSPFGSLRFIGAGVKDTVVGKLFRKFIVSVARLQGKSNAFVQQVFPAIKLYQGEPTDDFAKQVYFKNHPKKPIGSIDPPRENVGFIWTGPLIPFEGKHAKIALDIAQKTFDEFEFELFVELIVEGPRTLIGLFGVFFDPNNEEEKNRARAWYLKLSERMDDAGYPAYRATILSTENTLDRNTQLKEFLGKIKHAVDPQNILAPGRYGVGN